MIDSKILLNIIHKLIQPNIKTLLLLIIIVILFLKYTETNILLILILLFLVFIFYKDIWNTLLEIQKSEKKTERIIEDNKRNKKEIYFDEEIDTILSKMKKYRKYNRNAYEEGYNYIKMFMISVHDLERDDISHPKQYFENAEYYLKNGLNSFQSISIAVPEETFNETLKYNNYESTKLGNRIGKLCKKLQKHCYHLLYNLSLRLNKLFYEDIDIHKTLIVINSDNTEPIESSLHTTLDTKTNSNWNLY